jgi:hypothetical protein
MDLTREQFEELQKHSLYKGKVVTPSMVPVIPVGAQIVIDVGSKDLKRFDIIVIFIEGKLVCHYLWQMNKIVQPMLLQTRNMSGGLDFPVGFHDYLGKVISHRLSLWQRLKILF